VSIESLKQADFHEQLREFGFEIIDEGPEGLRAPWLPKSRAIRTSSQGGLRAGLAPWLAKFHRP